MGSLYKDTRPLTAPRRASKGRRKAKTKRATKVAKKQVVKTTKKVKKRAKQKVKVSKVLPRKRKVRVKDTVKSVKRKSDIRKKKSKSKKTVVRRKKVKRPVQELKPKNVFVGQMGEPVETGLIGEFVYNSSHANTFDSSVEGNISKVFTKAFNGYLSKSPFEAADIPIYSFGITIRPRKSSYLGAEDLIEKGKQINKILGEYKREAVVNVSNDSIRVYFPQPDFIDNKEVVLLLNERAEVLDEIYRYVIEDRDVPVDWWVNWHTEDAMYDG